MRVLLRYYNGKSFVWKEATYKGEDFWIRDDEQENEYRVYSTDIVAVDGDEYAGYVVCNNCGALIKNTPEEIAKHYAEMEKCIDCASCDCLTFSNKKITERTIVSDDDGYHVTESFVADPKCGVISYSPRSTDYAIGQRICKYMACRKHGVRQSNNVFIRYPGVFDTVITADVLTANKFKYDGNKGNYFVYDMRSRGTIKACVNELGIVEYFIVSSNGNKIRFYYSEKYDKMFYENGWKYEEGMPYWFRESKFNEAYQKIKALYKGAE